MQPAEDPLAQRARVHSFADCATREDRTMATSWITTAAALPQDGATVEFMLDERECPMRGVYALGRFESRWTNYAPTSVRQWRSTSSPLARLSRIGSIRAPAMHAASAA
jgi:hypothetical protein